MASTHAPNAVMKLLLSFICMRVLLHRVSEVFTI